MRFRYVRSGGTHDAGLESKLTQASPGKSRVGSFGKGGGTTPRRVSGDHVQGRRSKRTEPRMAIGPASETSGTVHRQCWTPLPLCSLLTTCPAVSYTHLRAHE